MREHTVVIAGGGPTGLMLAGELALAGVDIAAVEWELPAIGAVEDPGAVPIRPDGYVAWTGDQAGLGLTDALTTWFGPPDV